MTCFLAELLSCTLADNRNILSVIKRPNRLGTWKGDDMSQELLSRRIPNIYIAYSMAFLNSTVYSLPDMLL